jgi:hypothetical protein
MRARFALALSLALSLALAAGPASAAENAAADALFQQAKLLSDAKKWDAACPKFLASYKLDATLGTLLNLADCEEHVGKIATAWSHWGDAAEMARRTGDKRADYAGARREALGPKLPKIQLDVVVGQSSLAVQRDGVKIDPAAFGVPLPSDPGERIITVTRGEEVVARKVVVAKEAQISALALDLPAIEAAAPKPAGGRSPQRTAGFAVLGVGIGLVAVAGGLELGAMSVKSGATCYGAFCTPSGYETINKARTFANAGQWLGIGGLLVTAVGVTLAVTAPKPGGPKQAASLWAAPWAGPTGAGFGVGGAL